MNDGPRPSGREQNPAYGLLHVPSSLIRDDVMA